MADIPGNSTTTAVITVGGTVENTLETIGDHDWFAITLTAGQQITISLEGITLEDPYLRVRDAAGNVIRENDDISAGTIRDSKLSFTVPTTGTYYIDVGAWDENYTGTYKLSVQHYVPPPVWNDDQVADFLTSGYWNGDVHHFNVTQGGSLTVNITALTSAGQYLAQQALALWSDIIGVNFVYVTTGGQITFDDNEDGAHAEATWSGQITTSAHVNVSTQWLTNYGTSLNSYSFQTYIHEIGHALGLGHAGYYNVTGDYFSDALFANDGWPTTVMSYFSQTESSYFADLGFDHNYIATPMIADIVAIGRLYGLSTTTRAGDTVYGAASGWHTNMGAITIFDSGGIDWIDVSGLGGSHSINLTAGTFSNVMGEVGNVAIAHGVIIENARSGSGNDTLTGNSVNNRLESGIGNDTLFGAGGDDWLVPGWGNNHVDGGTGIDTVDYVIGTTASVTVNLASGVAHNQGGAGTDTLISIENVRGTHYNDTITGDAFANVLEGQDGNDVINGGGGNDRLFGDSGIDTMYGGTGDDTYYVRDAGDIVGEFAGEGFDHVVTTISFALAGNVEQMTLAGTAAINATGNAEANILYGNSASNILNGSWGADSMYGGGGDDTYYVHDAGDIVGEYANDGNDHVVSIVSYALGGNLEILTLAGSAAINATGNDLGNILYGNSASNILNGSWGADSMYGGGGDDLYYVHDAGDIVGEYANDGTDHVASIVSYALGGNIEILTLSGSAAINATGNAEANILYGNGASNILNGSWGNDGMYGAGGDDIYYVHDAGDIVGEYADDGNDHVVSIVSFALGGNIEILTLAGIAAIDGTGNVLANILYGNSANNVLNGSWGADTMYGGAGDDLYYVHDAGDIVGENAGEGSDHVVSLVSFTLSANVEHLTLVGDTAIMGVGNDGANTITGNGLANLLRGGGGNDLLNGSLGADSMYGGAGDDVYYVHDAGDLVAENFGEGSDTVASTVSFVLSGNVEHLILVGAAAIDGRGNELANSIYGNGAANQISGGLGHDTLFGDAGADTFLFDATLNSGANVDQILDFAAADDTIALDLSIFSALGAAGALGESAFRAGVAAADADDRIIYDSATGNLFYDADGNGAGEAVLFARLNPGTALTSGDFLLVP